MNTINCRIKLNDHGDVAGIGVTPAEAVVLRFLHDKHAGGNCILNPESAGKAVVFVPGEDETPASVRDRSDLEEYNRLRKKYPRRQSADKPNSSFLDDLFPGVATGGARLPQKFSDLPANYSVGEIKPARTKLVRTKDVSLPVAATEEQAAAMLAEANKAASATDGSQEQPEAAEPMGVKEDFAGKTKAQLLEIAGDYGLTVDPAATKAQLLEQLKTVAQAA